MPDLSSLSDDQLNQLIAAQSSGQSNTASPVSATPRLDLSSLPDDVLDQQIATHQAAGFKTALNQESGVGGNVASGYLRGISKLGDLADTVNNSPYNPISKGVDYLTSLTGGTPEASHLGNSLRSLFDNASGVQGSTEINPDTYAGKAGEYLPGILMGGKSLAGNGVSGAAKTIASLLGTDALVSGGGYTGRKIGNSLGHPDIGEAVGAGLFALAPTGANQAAKIGVGAFSQPATDSSAILNAFKVGDADAASALPVLNEMKAQGIINPGEGYQQIQNNLTDALKASEGKVQAGLDGAGGVTIGDITPKFSDYVGGNESGAELNAISSTVTAEQNGLLTKGLLRLSDEDKAILTPASDPSPKDLLNAYKRMGRNGNKSLEEAKLFDEITNKINSTELSASDLRDTRISYDKNAKFESANATPKADVYRGLRDNLQKTIVNLGGGAETGFDQVFKDYANQIAFKDYIDPLAGAELKGSFAPEPIGKQLLSGVKSLITKSVEGDSSPSYALKQIFGDTLPQKIASDSTTGQSILKALTPGAGALGAGVIASLFGAGQPDQAKADPLSSLVGSLYGKPTSTISSGDINMDKTPLPKNATKQDVVSRIDSDPFDKTVFEMESNRGKAVTNNQSSAKGAFQLIDSTVKKLGVGDVFDLGENYKGFQDLKAENQTRFGDDPVDLYGAHFLGATIYAKYLAGKTLTERQQNLVDQWEDIVRPRFIRKYKANLELHNGTVEA